MQTILAERSIRLADYNSQKIHATSLWKLGLEKFDNHKSICTLNKTYHYAFNLKYVHEGLDSAHYFLHPLRVASLCILHGSSEIEDAAVIGLLHNVIEVAEIDLVDFETYCGKNIFNCLDLLIVDRSLESNSAYKSQYYAKLMNASYATRLVKIFDKIDNMFILNLNHDEDMRKFYLAEIEKYILPLITITIPEIYKYTYELLCDCRVIGNL